MSTCVVLLGEKQNSSYGVSLFLNNKYTEDTLCVDQKKAGTLLGVGRGGGLKVCVSAVHTGKGVCALRLPKFVQRQHRSPHDKGSHEVYGHPFELLGVVVKGASSVALANRLYRVLRLSLRTNV